MNEREELEALRRMAELEARQRSGQLTETLAEATKRQDTNPAYGMSGGERALAGAGKFFSDIGQGVGQMVGAVPQEAVDERARLDAPLMNTGTGRAGYMGAGAISGVPTLAIPGANTMTGAALLGAVMGGVAPVPTGDSRIKNMALGAAGGAAAQGVGNLVGRLNQPVQSKLPPELADLAQKAEGMGIPLDAADKTGSRPLKIIRSVFESLPGTADKQAALNEAKRAAFNRAVMGEVGESATKATPDVLNNARTRIGGEFERLTKGNEIAMGNDFLDAIVKVDAARNEFTSPAVATAVDKALALLTRAEKQGGKISGADYQKIRSTLGKASKDAYAAQNSELGGALKTIRKALNEEARNSLPASEKAAWDEASRQWQNLKIVEKAAAPTTADAVAGNVSPAKLAQALQSTDKQGYTYGTRGDNMSDLARVGQAFVKDQIPNSGTAERTFWTRFMENPLNAVWQGGAGGISRPLQSLMNSPAGQRYFTAGVIPDSEKRKLTAELLKRGLVGGVSALPISEAQQ